MAASTWKLAFRLLVPVCVVWAFAAAGSGSLVHWTRVPGITVISADSDQRLGMIPEAVAYWNNIITELGTPFRLGEIYYAVGTIPDQDVQNLSDQVLGHRPRLIAPASLEHIPGDMVIVLSDADFISFTANLGSQVVIAIKNGRIRPLSLPNVLVNVIAHEIGHGVGLQHNSDPALLMCGRPASCRPDAFQSATPKMFPLSEQERKHLLALYPSRWTAAKPH